MLEQEPYASEPRPWPSQQDLRFVPSIRISFKSREDRAEAWGIVANNRPTVGIPNRGIVVAPDQLLMLRDADIPVYPLAPAEEEQQYDEPLNINGYIEGMIQRHYQKRDVGEMM